MPSHTQTKRTSKRNLSRKLPYFARERLLSQGETIFFSILRRAVAGRYLIAPKVRAADILHCDQAAWEEGFGHYVARHHLDFVLCDQRTTAILAAIELDDRSHAEERRRQRDKFLDDAFAAAKIPLLRFRAKARYVVADVMADIEQVLVLPNSARTASD